MRNQSTILVLEALIRGDKDITALNQGKYYTTRLTNIISDLRNKHGIEIKTITNINPNTGKIFASYELPNKQKAFKLYRRLKPFKIEDAKPIKAETYA
jgi:hypothetical protein